MHKIIKFNKPLSENQLTQLVAVWRRSKAYALGDYIEPHDEESMQAFFKHVLQEQAENWLVLEGTDIIGFMSIQDDWLNQLYIAPQNIGQAIGYQLIKIAKKQCPSGIKLYCFQQNERAVNFYKKHDFRIKKSGRDNEENLPDYLMIWMP